VNAYESIPHDREGVVSMTVEMEQDYILVRVRDNGKGIPHQQIPGIFEMGFTTKGRRQMHGVGLYHCKQIMDAHKGSLSVQSELSVGTEFEVRLPRQQIEEIS
ncbi:MAG: ATP-binding protein, partial [Anaerolineales bacterium]|nr:ATP-binding protein [Anaerolineales bacterium]